MKIFHLGLCVGEPPKDSMRKAFLANCDQYRELSTGALNVNQAAIHIVREFKPDIVFMQIQAANIISIQTVQEFKRNRAWVCNWNGDIRHHTPDWMIHMSRVIDKTLFSNMRDAKNVHNGGYLEIGYDPEIYCPEGEQIPCRPIAFFGNNYGADAFPLSFLRLDMNTMLRHYFPHQYGVYGTNWPNPNGSYNHSQSEEAKAYRSVKIGINVSHFDEDTYTSDRMLRILGTGTFCLSKRYPNMPYEDGKHLVCWETLPELVDKCRYYLEHDRERVEIARQGHEYVKNTFTFDAMIKRLIEIYKTK